MDRICFSHRSRIMARQGLKIIKSELSIIIKFFDVNREYSSTIRC